MFQILQTTVFEKWLRGMRDRRAKDRILARLVRMGAGNLGDVKSVGEGVTEARIDYGPGYRLYFIRHKKTVLVMLGGGDKSSQARDIKRAKELAKGWEI